MRALNVLLAIVVSLLIAVGVAEGGLRLLGFGPPPLNTEFDPVRGWRLEKDKTIHRTTKEYDVTIATDAHGLRDDYASDDVSKPDGTYRAVFLGDSFVVGYTVDRDELFVDQLERAWRDEKRNVEIVNAGTQAYATDQALLWLRENGEAFDPDVVVLFPYENDIWWNAQDQYLGQDKPLISGSGALTERELDQGASGWLRKTAIGRLIGGFSSPKKLASVQAPSVESGKAAALNVEMSSRLVDPPQPTLDAEERTRVIVAELAKASHDLGARFVVCPLPSKAQMPERTPGPKSVDPAALDPNRPYQLFAEAGRAAGATVLEPLDALRAAAESDDPYYGTDFHLDASGNAALAGYLYEEFDAKGLVPARDGDVAAATPSAVVEAPSKGFPKWPLWFLGLWGALGTLYARTYKDENAGAAYAKVGALLGVVFATALGVTWLVGALPPAAGRFVLVGLVLALLGFVLYKLGERVGTIGELLKAFTLRGHWYLMPLLSVLLTVGSLLVVAASSPLVAPFIYTLF
ncbi:MAG: DUF5989 family protein [Planctomycetota bacterium]